MRRYRRGLQVGLLVVIAAFIASLFVFGQRGFGDGAGRDAVATVNGESIPLARYQQRYQAFMEAYARIYRDRFSPELAERLGLPQQVVNELIQEALIVQRARAEGLLVTDEELNAQIQAVPAFQENGRFALKRYQEYVRRRGLAAAAFENEMRRELTRMKVEQAVRGGVKVTPAEVEHAFVLRREEARAAWALVEFGPLIAAASASDDELGKYLGAHQDEFRQPERRRILSVTLTPKDFLKPVADAKEASEDPGSASKGGDLGWVGAGELVPQFEQALFALKKGEMSPEPVRSPFGFHAIRVLDVRAGGKKPLKDVAGQIHSRLQTEATEKAMQARAEAIRRELLAAQDFTAEAKRLGLAAVESTVSRTDRFAGVSAPDPLEEAAFNLAQGGVSPPVKTPAGLVLLKAVATIPAGVPALAEIKDRVALAVRREKAEAQARERATQLAEAAKGGDFLAAAKRAGAVTGETSRFSRAKPAEKLPGDAMLAALRAPLDAVTEPVKAPQGYYVLRVLERVAPDPGALAGERATVTKEVLAQKQSQAWESWLNAARVNAKVEVHFNPTSRRG